ncbi:MAG: hypothetical protein R3C31_02300 [Hyphomonadaceae bacterium]
MEALQNLTPTWRLAASTGPGHTMGAAFSMHRGRAWLGVLVCSAFGVICLASALGASGLWRVFGIAFGVVCLALVVNIARWLLHKGPYLVVSAEGLLYAPFADRPVPWNEITAMTRILAFGRSQFLNKTTWTRAPRSDQLNFDVGDLTAYPNSILRQISRGLQRLGGLPPISIQLGVFDAEPDAIVAEIKKYWTGLIAEFDPRPISRR